MKKVKSLFIAANPHQTERLVLDQEIREIKAKVRSSEYRNLLELVSEWAVRPDELLQYLNMHKPQIVHFSGHGSAAGEIILVDQNNLPKPVSASALRTLFTTLKDNVRLVILNACYSRIQAQSIVQVVDCAIGIKDSISDEAAIIFIASVYRAIGFGRSIKEAFEQGKTALLLEGILEENMPELLAHDNVNPALIILIKNYGLEYNDNSINDSRGVQLKGLLSKLSMNFSLEELKTICFNLGVDPESIPGTTKDSTAREMLLYFRRRDQIDILIEECRQQRPHISW